jgi:hypothetical protein
MNDHLRAVTEAPVTSPPEPPTTSRAERRVRPNKPLPTDRMKHGTEVNALKAIAVASRFGERGVSAEDIGARIGVTTATAGLSNAFFAEAGWITRESKGRYLPTDATNTFAQKLGFNETEAAALLAPSIRESWYFREIAPELQTGPVAVGQLVQVLAQAAGATSEYEPQLESVLLWLEYVGLVVIADGHVQLGQRDPQELQKPPVKEDDENQRKAPEAAAEPARGESQEPTKKQRLAQANAVISLDFDLSLTAEDLAKLKPEQITALFEAVGQVAAIKATIS